MGLNFGAEKIRAAENFPLEGWAPCAGKSVASQNAACSAPSPAPIASPYGRSRRQTRQSARRGAFAYGTHASRGLATHTAPDTRRPASCPPDEREIVFPPAIKSGYGPEGHGTNDLPGNSVTPD